MAVSDMLPRRRVVVRFIAGAAPAVLTAGLLVAASLRSWSDGDHVWLLVAVGLLALSLVLCRGDVRRAAQSGVADSHNAAGLLLALAGLDESFAAGRRSGHCAACMVIRFDNFAQILDAHGRFRQIEALTHLTRRLRNRIPASPAPFLLSDDSVAILIPPSRQSDREALADLAVRMQAVVAEPIQIDGIRHQVTASVGFCADCRAPGRSGRALLDAAQIAAEEACRRAPGGLCSYSPELVRAREAGGTAHATLVAAMSKGEIRPHFQPQLCADTGEISGCEALARWQHPERGLLCPAEFLPAISRFDLSERLGEVMLHESLASLARWDRAGLRVPSISVNFSADQLRNPWLPERIRWELDRHGLRPPRLTVEILETVVAAAENDLLLSNIAQLSAMGCGIDLDDFGTGHASIWTIRRFQIRRLKIDRFFVSGVDHDRGQKQMVSAILALAERLQLDTVAEGVETPGEHAVLSQLGCGHLQGFGIARPMSFDDATAWIMLHNSRKDATPRIGLPRG